MDKGKIALGVLSLVLVGLAMGYVVATGFVMFRYGLSPTRGVGADSLPRSAHLVSDSEADNAQSDCLAQNKYVHEVRA